MAEPLASYSIRHELDSGLPVGRRGAARLRLSLAARLVTLSDTRRCILIDLSRTGAQVGLERPLAEGESAFLQLSGFDEFGEVVRRAIGPRGGYNGIVFDEPLSDQKVIDVRRFSESVDANENIKLRREVRAWVNGTQ